MQQLPQNYKKSVSIPASGSPVPMGVSGTCFLCLSASAGKFLMSYDGANFFDMQKGLTFGPSPVPYKQLFFKPYPGATATNLVEFYHGEMPMGDNRLVLIDGSASSTIFFQDAPFIPYLVWSGAFATTDVVNLDGFRTIGGKLLYRRSLHILTQWNAVPAAGAAYKRLTVGTTAPVLDENVGTWFQTTPEVPQTFWGSEPLFINNGSGAAVNAYIYETFFNPT
jgi:hypothetical protein